MGCSGRQRKRALELWQRFFKCLLAKSEVPDEWKIANRISLFKKGSREKLGN